MKTNLNHFRGAALVSAMACCLIASAAEQTPCSPGASDPQQRREPPPQAYQDCKGKQAGDAVQITPPQGGTISATCTSSPKGLFARPDHPPDNRDDTQRNQNK